MVILLQLISFDPRSLQIQLIILIVQPSIEYNPMSLSSMHANYAIRYFKLGTFEAMVLLAENKPIMIKLMLFTCTQIIYLFVFRSLYLNA